MYRAACLIALLLVVSGCCPGGTASVPAKPDSAALAELKELYSDNPRWYLELYEAVPGELTVVMAQEAFDKEGTPEDQKAVVVSTLSLWSKIYSPDAPHLARIKFINEDGELLAGSQGLSGEIWVKGYGEYVVEKYAGE